MKIAVLAANGKAGNLIVSEAIKRGHDVTAIVRNENKTKAKNFLIKDIMQLDYNDLKEYDAIIDAFGAWTEETLPNHTTTQQHLCDILSGHTNKLYIVGGAGALYVDPSHTTTLAETPDFPDVFIPVATAVGNALEKLETRADVNWTYVMPAADFQFDRKPKGEYKICGSELTLSDNGESVLSYTDYATAMLDIVESDKDNTRKRLSVVEK